MGLEPRLTPPHATDAALGVAGAALLEASPPETVAVAHGVDHGPGEMLAFAVGSEIDDAQIHPQHAAVRPSLRRGFAALRHMQVVGAGSPDQIGPTDLPRRITQQRVLARPHDQATDNPPLQRVEGDPIQAHQAVGARVVADTPARAEPGAGRALLGLDRLDGFNGLHARADGGSAWRAALVAETGGDSQRSRGLDEHRVSPYDTPGGLGLGARSGARAARPHAGDVLCGEGSHGGQGQLAAATARRTPRAAPLARAGNRRVRDGRPTLLTDAVRLHRIRADRRLSGGV